jgi:DNA ligase 1
MSFRPLLAPGEDPLSFPDYFKLLQYPLLCSPKYDGIRAIVKNGAVLSRSGKLLPSFQVQDMFGQKDFSHYDGEIIDGNPTDFGVYNRTQSKVMSADKEGDFTFFVFDYTHPEIITEPYYARLDNIATETPHVKVVYQHLVEDYDSLIAFENKCLEEGYEGIMMRNPVAPYKNGRATFRQNIIYKLKRFTDAEGIVVGIYEEMRNDNELEKDELGYAKRSDKKEFKVPSGKAGGFIIDWGDDVLDVAPGAFTHQERKEIWEDKHFYIGKTLKFRYMQHGMKDKPRFPRALGFRDPMDL